MTEREALLKKAQRYLDSAKLLLESGDYDSAVSRIYYAAFFAAEMMLDSLKLEYSSHKAVISAENDNPRLRSGCVFIKLRISKGVGQIRVEPTSCRN